MAEYLQTLRPTIGQFEANKAEIKLFFVERLQELSAEAKQDRLSIELCRNLARMSRLLSVLLLFQNAPDEAGRYEEFSGINS
jgi:hypothetical protein